MLDRKILKYSFLDFVKSVMVLIEYSLGTSEIIVDLGSFMPRKVKNCLNICPADISIRTHRVHFGELIDFLADLGIHFFIELQSCQLFFPVSDFIIDILVLAKLFFNDLKLLSEIILSLASVHVLDDPVVDPLGNGKDIVLPADYINKVSDSQLD